MAKKHRKNEPALIAPVASSLLKGTISPIGKKMIAGGITLLIVGFGLLTKTDTYGRNWASTLAPFLILGAYGLIAAGMFLPTNTESSQPGTPPLP